ncbi:uncharacterized protein LOC134242596 [Saccostrea cucullata]|uniref:uncharacterized protein LOC134242596 n=1 Tax=Saccostrea cuccullata TaxID=36930 RepID=UPI002ED545FE
MSDIKDEIDSNDVIVNGNDISKLFIETYDINRYRNLPEKILPCLPQFTPRRIGEELSKLFGTLSPSSLTSDEHGYSMKTTQKSPEAGSSPPVKQLLDEPETVTTIDTGYRHLYLDNVACLSDEEIWTSGNDKTMKLFSINQGSLRKSITTKYITENRNLDICVSDSGANAVVVVNQAEKLRFRYTGHTPALKNQPFRPRGITTDSQSHILTADTNNDCVHIIDQNEQFLRYIDCGWCKPWGLCTDTNDNLFVVQCSNSQVKKIKYLK